MDLELITKALEATVSHGMSGHFETGPTLHYRTELINSNENDALHC